MLYKYTYDSITINGKRGHNFDTEWRDAYGKAKEENKRNTVTKLQSQENQLKLEEIRSKADNMTG